MSDRLRGRRPSQDVHQSVNDRRGVCLGYQAAVLEGRQLSADAGLLGAGHIDGK